MNEHEREIILAAIGYFKDWTNVLLVTTTAALGWVTTTKGVLDQATYRSCAVSFAVSIVFGILTLAMIPLITELYAKVPMKPKQTVPNSMTDVRQQNFCSFYDKTPTVFLCKHPLPRLTWFCFPQHLFFLIGILLYAFMARPVSI